MSEVHIIADLQSVSVQGDPATIVIKVVTALTEHNAEDVHQLARMKRTRAPIAVHILCTQAELPEPGKKGRR